MPSKQVKLSVLRYLNFYRDPVNGAGGAQLPRVLDPPMAGTSAVRDGPFSNRTTWNRKLEFFLMHCSSDRLPCDWVLEEHDRKLIIFDIIEVATHFTHLVNSRRDVDELKNIQKMNLCILVFAPAPVGTTYPVFSALSARADQSLGERKSAGWCIIWFLDKVWQIIVQQCANSFIHGPKNLKHELHHVFCLNLYHFFCWTF